MNVVQIVVILLSITSVLKEDGCDEGVIGANPPLPHSYPRSPKASNRDFSLPILDSLFIIFSMHIDLIRADAALSEGEELISTHFPSAAPSKKGYLKNSIPDWFDSWGRNRMFHDNF